MKDFLPLGILFITGLAVFFDIRKRIIPNWLTIPAFLIVLVIEVYIFTLPEFIQILQTLFVATILFLTLFYLQIFGGGDVKLLLVIACTVAPFEFLRILFFIFLFGGIQAILTMFYLKIIKKKEVSKITIPYGIAIFLGYGWYLFIL
jgi:prepilin peptidase CpaA